VVEGLEVIEGVMVMVLALPVVLTKEPVLEVERTLLLDDLMVALDWGLDEAVVPDDVDLPIEVAFAVDGADGMLLLGGLDGLAALVDATLLETGALLKSIALLIASLLSVDV